MYKKGQEISGRVIEAATILFQQKGFENTSFQDLADASGVPKGNFYHYFRSKDDVLYAVLEARLSRLNDQLRALEEQSADPFERVDGFLRSLLKDPTDPFIYGCPHGSLCMELLKGRSELLSKGAEVLVRLGTWFSEQFRAAGVEAGRHQALRLLSRMQGVILLGSAFRDHAFAKREIQELRGWVKSLKSNDVARARGRG
jgi:AcrR family transcriptional regulator